ncbi:eCIS core domain-containing protein [Agriterribacter humi]|uniref:eCIS core domain-containing protein n=1 Tax=Agriterribacter humi TaxID=1104781 RepID=UPI001265062A|nr:DUF4157 domain-containing protein [Agriterribacter humi]
MKTAEAKTASVARMQKANQSFFSKEAEGNFFGSNNARKPSFFKSPTAYGINSSAKLQTKLTIGQHNDKYEQEADSMADTVVQRLNAPGVLVKNETVQTKPLATSIVPLVQTKCTHCEEEEKLQTKMDETSAVTASPTIESNLYASKGNGRSLSDVTKLQMENAFGADFSGIRIHNDSSAVQMNKDLQAQAFTHEHDIYFNAGKYDTNSTTGKHLLAHELTHTIQQGASLLIRKQPALKKNTEIDARKTAPAIQRSMGFEFQTRNKITTNQDRKFPRKFGKYFHKGKTGVEMQTDTGSVLEFETAPFRTWSKLEAQIQEAVDIVRAINNSFGEDPVFSWNEEHRRSKMFTFSEEKRMEKLIPLKKGEQLKVDIRDPEFVAAIQSSEGLALSQYESLLREHEKPEFIDPVINDANGILDAAKKANKKIGATVNTDNLRGFLQVIVNYITRGQEVLSTPAHVSPVKARFRLMHRTSFSSMFNSLLGADEKTLFKYIIANNVIPKTLKLDANDPLFAEGYWGHFDNMMALFQDGKITALSTEDKEDIHDCASKVKPPPHIDASKCGKNVPQSNITINQWLLSIISKDIDLLSPPHRGASSMGKLKVPSKGEEKQLAIFETRGYRRDRTQPFYKWVDFAETLFQQAAECRKRPDTGTDLIYDGTNRFTWGLCLFPD